MSIRLQITVNEEMLEKLDFYCQKLAVGRSALSSMLIGTGLAGLDKSFNVIDDVSEQLKLDVSKLVGQQLKIDGEK